MMISQLQGNPIFVRDRDKSDMQIRVTIARKFGYCGNIKYFTCTPMKAEKKWMKLFGPARRRSLIIRVFLALVVGKYSNFKLGVFCNTSPDSSRSPPRGRHAWHSERRFYCDAPYSRTNRNHRHNNLCKNCKRPGHFVRDCPNEAVCNNCGLPGHLASECNSKIMCWNCKESGHIASECINDPTCHVCGKAGHIARDCSGSDRPHHDTRLCNNCHKPGHFVVDCTNEKACNNCRETGHLAREWPNKPVCNLCNVAGHVARQCRTCNLPGHISRDSVEIVIYINCGRCGHLAFECPSGQMFDQSFRR